MQEKMVEPVINANERKFFFATEKKEDLVTKRLVFENTKKSPSCVFDYRKDFNAIRKLQGKKIGSQPYERDGQKSASESLYDENFVDARPNKAEVYNGHAGTERIRSGADQKRASINVLDNKAFLRNKNTSLQRDWRAIVSDHLGKGNKTKNKAQRATLALKTYSKRFGGLDVNEVKNYVKELQEKKYN